MPKREWRVKTMASPGFGRRSIGRRVSSLDQLPQRADEYGSAWWHRVETDDIEVPIFIRLARTRSGRIACVGVVVGESDGSIEVTSTDLSRVALREIVETYSRGLRENRHVDDGDDPLDELLRVGFEETTGPIEETAERIQGARVWQEDQYRGLAELFLQAKVEAPGRHIKWIVDKWPGKVSEATVHRRLAEAERRKLLTRSDEIETGGGK